MTNLRKWTNPDVFVRFSVLFPISTPSLVFVGHRHMKRHRIRSRTLQESAGKDSLHSCTLTWTHADITQHGGSSRRAAGEPAGGDRGKERKTFRLSASLNFTLIVKSEKRLGLSSTSAKVYFFSSRHGQVCWLIQLDIPVRHIQQAGINTTFVLLLTLIIVQKRFALGCKAAQIMALWLTDAMTAAADLDLRARGA